MGLSKMAVSTWLTLILGASSVASVSCTLDYISNKKAIVLREEIKKKDLLCLVEGVWTAQTGRAMAEYIEEICSDADLAGVAVSGDGKCLIPYIQEAVANGRRVYLGGFSLGDDNAEDVAKACGVPIEILFLLDGTKAKKISSNVRKVVYFHGTDAYLFRGRNYVHGDLENSNTILRVIRLDGTGHLDVPDRAKPYVKEIMGSRR